MTRKRTPKAAKNKATALHSKIVRARGACESCGETYYPLLQCAHIISRTFSATRTDLDNAFCLCAACHRRFTQNPLAFADFALEKLGMGKLAGLRAKAQPAVKVDWEKECERLAAIWKLLDVEDVA